MVFCGVAGGVFALVGAGFELENAVTFFLLIALGSALLDAWFGLREKGWKLALARGVFGGFILLFLFGSCLLGRWVNQQISGWQGILLAIVCGAALGVPSGFLLWHTANWGKSFYRSSSET